MKTSRILWALALVCIAASSCNKEPKEAPAANVAWAPATAISGAVSFTLGQAQSIAMTAENIDFVNVVSKPEAWTVTATPDKVDIKAPTGLEASFDLSGEIKFEAVNREQGKNIPLSVNVAVDESTITGKIEFTSDVVYTQVFNAGETKVFNYAASFVSEVSATAPQGWTAAVDAAAKTVSVTAPASFEGTVAISGEITVNAKSITGASIDAVSFGVALPVYKVTVPSDPAAKVYGIYDEDGNGLGILCIASAGNYAYVKGNKIDVASEAVFTAEGAGIASYVGDAQATATSPYTVKDDQGNEYNTICANGHLFMDSNFRATTGPGGSAYPIQYPGLVETNLAEYGALYNQGTAFNEYDPSDGAIRGICPEGWHLPLVSDIAPEYNAETDGVAILSFDTDLYNSFKACPAGMVMVLPIMGMGSMPIMFGQAASFQLSSASYITMVFQEGIELDQLAELQTNPSTFMSVRCVKDSLLFSE